MRETSLLLSTVILFLDISISVFAFKTCHAAGLPDLDKI